jgi:hypothetical protein
MGNRMVPASKARGIPNKLMPQSTIFAEEAILLRINTVTNKTMIRS